MANEEEKTPLITIGAFLDKDNDPIAVVVIGGVTYARMERTLEEAIETSRRSIGHLEQYRKAGKLHEVTVDHTTPRDASKEN